MTVAAVTLWGSRIGAVSIEDGSDVATFQYERDFIGSGIQLSPIVMPLRQRPYSFPSLSRESFRGLPGMLADSLPDKFGNALIDSWLASQGRTPDSFDVVERLCYIGSRGMGALEFAPARGPTARHSTELHIDALVELASEVLTRRNKFVASLEDAHAGDAVRDILLVGTSAGGARAKAVIAYNPVTRAVRSGQIDAGPGFEYWILKFDGVSGNKDKELEDPKGYCAIEYAYSLMARAARIDMMDCRLLEENGRRHFMTKRFDRVNGVTKLHMQSLAALGHYDFNQPAAHSYEQAFLVIRQLGLDMRAIDQMFRRMVFNIVGRNQDDHVKNIAFLMERDGQWRLAPAFDMTYAYSSTGLWTRQHQMSLNGKRDSFVLEDFVTCADSLSMKRGAAERILTEVQDVFAEWPVYARKAGVSQKRIDQIHRTHRLDIVDSHVTAPAS